MKRRQQIIGLALCSGLLTTAAVGSFTGCASSPENRSSGQYTGQSTGPMTGESTGQYTDDKTVQNQVSSALGDNTDYNFDKVNVDVNQGSARLSGYVDSYDQKMKAYDITKNVPGVTDVQNDIIVRPTPPGTRP